MFRIFARSIFFVTFFLMITGGANAAAKDNFVKSLGLKLFQQKAFRVTSSDGETYDGIESADFDATIDVDLRWPGALDAVIIHLGECTGHRRGCDEKRIMYRENPSARDFRKRRQLSFQPRADFDFGRSLIASCNARVDEAQGAGSDLTNLPQLFPVTLGVDTRRDLGKISPLIEATGKAPLDEYSKTKVFSSIQFNFACAALPQPIKTPPEPWYMKLIVNQQGDTCPMKTEVRTILKYNIPMTARFRIKHNGKPGKYIEIKARDTLKGKDRPLTRGRYLVERVEYYYLDPGKHDFRVEVIGGTRGTVQSSVETIRVKCPPFKVTSAWLTYDVGKKSTCKKQVKEKLKAKATRPGNAPFEIKTQGGLVVHSGTLEFARKGMEYVAVSKRKLQMGAFDSDMMGLIDDGSGANTGWTRLKVDCLNVLSGNLELRKFKPTSCKGEAAMSVRTDMPGTVKYWLTCTGERRSWEGKIDVHKTGANTYVGVDRVQFDVQNNEHVNCAFKQFIDGKTTLLDMAGETFQCVKPTDVGGADDLVNDTREPDPLPPRPRVSGDFSFIDNTGTKCKRKGKALINFKTIGPSPQGSVHWSLDCTNGKNFSGVAQAVKSASGGYVAPAYVTFNVKKTTQMTCALKSVAPGKARTHTVKGHKFLCIKPIDVGGADDLAPDRDPVPSSDTVGPSVVVDPVPQFECDNGRTVKGECVCRRGLKRTRTGPNKYRCEPKKPNIVIADPTTEPTRPIDPQTGSDDTASISCDGGTVKDDACQCPRTHKAVKAGKNAWRCKKFVVIDPVRTDGKKTSGQKTSTSNKDAERRRLERLKKKKAEEARRKAAKKKAAEERRREAAAKRKAEAKRKAAAKRRAEAKRKAAAKRKAEAKRKAAAKRKAEAKRKAAAKKKAAKKRKARLKAKKKRTSKRQAVIR